MTHKNDSLLDAAKKTATALGLGWSDLQQVYRSLQQEDADGTGWLPKSVGRKIWTAKPSFVAKLVTGYGFNSSAFTPHEGLYLLHGLTRNGGSMPIEDWPSAGVKPPAEKRLAQIVSDPDEAAKIAELRFDAGAKSITIKYVDGSEEVFAPMSDDPWDADDVVHRRRIIDVLRKETGPLSTVLRIQGSAIAEIAESVVWDFSGSPMRAGEVSEEDTDE
ncbi:hypothetical protein [uncultured Jannaschia sp.]|uniref:hypothetical protein n=1 Tax=uncultured Jannaschia sp. TaxID=293347 RepID=UPI002633D609|nr:hypothetical protein [uncultured Jannaschia sp.]